MTNENGDIRFRTWREKGQAFALFCIANAAAFGLLLSGVKLLGGGAWHVGLYAVTMANVPTQIDQMQAGIRAIQEAQQKQISDQADRVKIGDKRWENSDNQFRALDSHVDDLEHRVEHLEGPALHAFGAMATGQDDIAYGKCCTHNDCRSWQKNPCTYLRKGKDQ